MLVLRNAVRATRAARFSTTPGRFASSLVFLEQKGGKLNDQALTAVTAAQQVGGDVSSQTASSKEDLNIQVSGIVIGSASDVAKALEEAKG